MESERETAGCLRIEVREGEGKCIYAGLHADKQPVLCVLHQPG